MSKYRFTHKDINDINNLIKSISNLLIDDIYKKMYKLECEDKKDTTLYNDLILNLKEKLNQEKQEYEKYDLTSSKILEWLKYLISTYISNNVNDVESVIDLNYSNSNIRRMINILNKKILSNKEDISDNLSINQELIDKLEKIGVNDAVKVVHNSFYYNIEINKALYDDLLNIFLYITNELQNEKNYQNLKKYLIEFKYHMAYIDTTLEKSLVSKKFNIDSKLYISSKVTTDLFGINSDMYDMLKNYYNIDICFFQISKLINLSDMDYGDLKSSISSVLRQCLLRSTFILMDDYVIEDINNKFIEYIESNKYLDIHNNDKISRQLLINCFNGVKKDKSKALILSLSCKS